jgi:hypothetical protein
MERNSFDEEGYAMGKNIVALSGSPRKADVLVLGRDI